MCEGYKSWLPDLIQGEDLIDKWDEFEDEVYQSFEESYLDVPLTFLNYQIKYKRLPLRNGKHGTFYHLVTWGSDVHEDRNVSYERCQRIKWAKAIIANYTDPDVFVWENERKGTVRICLYLVPEKYLVILEPRTEKCEVVMYLWTAYIVDSEHYHRNLIKSYKGFNKANAAFLRTASLLLPQHGG